MKRKIASILVLPGLLILAANSSLFAQTTFSNTGEIIINDGSPATPYPSEIAVSGLGNLTNVTVTLTGITHSFPDDIDILLVGPQGQQAVIFSDVGGGPDLTAGSYTITLDDAALLPVPDTGTLASGTFKPTNTGAGDPFPAPAPAGAPGSLLSVFNGTNPNGTWSLYVVDDSAQDNGSITGGWALNITAAAVPEPSTWLLLGAGMAGIVMFRRFRC
jgi:subtilisin-like proprotein convertase family protein